MVRRVAASKPQVLAMATHCISIAPNHPQAALEAATRQPMVWWLVADKMLILESIAYFTCS